MTRVCVAKRTKWVSGTNKSEMAGTVGRHGPCPQRCEGLSPREFGLHADDRAEPLTCLNREAAWSKPIQEDHSGCRVKVYT